MKRIGSYKNGNYVVHMFDDGTKIRANSLDFFSAAFPESMDMKICNRCDMGCPMCHERSVPDGALANLNHPILDSIHPYTELALGGGNPLEHPDLEAFLLRMKKQKVICNLTVHVNHFMREYQRLKKYSEEGLLHGVGVSVNAYCDEKTINTIANFPNAVVHVIAGLVPDYVMRSMYDKGIKLLILGYKNYGRGETFYQKYPHQVEQHIQSLESSLDELSKHFTLISFDNLAIAQLHVRDHVSKEKWDACYMGDDGEYTMYIDLVKEEYAASSVSPRYPLTQNTIENVFSAVKQRRENGTKRE